MNHKKIYNHKQKLTVNKKMCKQASSCSGRFPFCLLLQRQCLNYTLVAGHSAVYPQPVKNLLSRTVFLCFSFKIITVDTFLSFFFPHLLPSWKMRLNGEKFQLLSFMHRAVNEGLHSCQNEMKTVCTEENVFIWYRNILYFFFN